MTAVVSESEIVEGPSKPPEEYRMRKGVCRIISLITQVNAGLDIDETCWPIGIEAPRADDEN